MKTLNSLPKSQIALAIALIALRPAFGADTPSSSTVAAEAHAEKAEAESDATKASLDLINARIDAIEKQIENAPDKAEKTAAKARLKGLKDRRFELRKHYAKSKSDELLADLKVEYTKVASWTKDTYKDVKEKVTGDDKDEKPGVVPATQAAVNTKANEAMVGIAVYKMNPSPENKAEVKAAIDALENEIDRLEDRADALPEGKKRDAMEKRIEALDDRKDSLEDDFTKARWDNLVKDLRESWNGLFE